MLLIKRDVCIEKKGGKMCKKKSLIMLLVMLLMPVLLGKGITVYAKTTEIFYDGKGYEYTRFPGIHIDGQKMKKGIMPPIITPSQRTIVPVREFFESIGDRVEWDNKKKEVHIYHDEKELVIAIGQYIVQLDGVDIKMDETAKLVINKTDHPNQSKTMVPLRFIMENFGYKVEWDGDNYMIHLTSEKPKATKLREEPIVWKSDESITSVPIPQTDILTQDKKVTNIIGIEEITKDKKLTYQIKADSGISKVSSVVWNNMLIIDIEDSIKAYEEELYPLEGNPYFKQIRSSQFSDKPKITRVVFDMKYEDVAYDLKLSTDRKILTLTVMKNYIHGITLAQDEQGDYVDIKGLFQPALDIFWLSNPTRLVVDVPYAGSAFSYKDTEAEGIYVGGMRTATFDTNTARIVLDLVKRAEFTVEKVDDYITRVRLVKPSYKNVSLDYKNQPTIVIAKRAEISAKDLVVNDEYRKKQATFTISKDMAPYYGDGEIHVNDDDIRSIKLFQDDKGYHIQLDTKKVKAYKVTEDENNLYIKIMKPQDVYEKVIVVDPGHGGTDPGKPISKGNYTYQNEKAINLDISLRLAKLLEKHKDIKVYMTRETDVYPGLPERCDLANEVEADFFVSVHNNAFMSKFEGTEMLYFDPYKGKTTEFAKIMLRNLVNEAGTINRGLRYRGDLFVLKHTKMSAVIVEVAYMTNQRDATKLKNPDFLQKSAVGIYKGILESYEELN